MRARFFAEETSRASYAGFEGWVRKHGLPASLYVDRDSLYRCEGLGSIAEQLAAKAPQTQFERAMAALGVELILAHSPQAKGRVERMNGTLQDRLVKELRLLGISTLEAANAFMPSFIADYNQRFAKLPKSGHDRHRPVRPDEDQELILAWQEPRCVSKSLTLQYDKVLYLLDDTPENRA